MSDAKEMTLPDNLTERIRNGSGEGLDAAIEAFALDVAWTAWNLAKQPNDEDGGPSDWFTDTRPKIIEACKRSHPTKDALLALLAAKEPRP